MLADRGELSRPYLRFLLLIQQKVGKCVAEVFEPPLDFLGRKVVSSQFFRFHAEFPRRTPTF